MILVLSNKSSRIYLNIFGDTVVQSLKVENTIKWPGSYVKVEKNLWIYSWYSLPDLKHAQERFICIPLLNFPEMRPLGTFKSLLRNGNHGNDCRYKNFNFITIKKKERKLAIIKMFTFFVSDHLNLEVTPAQKCV